MAEINETGYISLRTLIIKEWNKLTLLDESDKEVISVDLDEDNWIHERDTERVETGRDDMGRPQYSNLPFESNQELKIEVVVSGSDVDSLPTTVSQSVLTESYSINKEESDPDAHRVVSKEQFQPFTFESANDELTITHTISVPVVD